MFLRTMDEECQTRSVMYKHGVFSCGTFLCFHVGYFEFEIVFCGFGVVFRDRPLRKMYMLIVRDVGN